MLSQKLLPVYLWLLNTSLAPQMRIVGRLHLTDVSKLTLV